MLVSKREAAAAAGVTVRTINRWIKAGKLSTYRRSGGRPWVLVELSEVAAVVTAREVEEHGRGTVRPGIKRENPA